MAIPSIHSNSGTSTAQVSNKETYQSFTTVDAKVDAQRVGLASRCAKAISSIFTRRISNENAPKATLDESLSMLAEKTNSLNATPSGQAVTEVLNAKSTIESQLDALSFKIDKELSKPEKERNYETLQALMYMLVMLMMRKTAKTDQEFITEMGNQIKLETKKIEETYQNITVLTITLISSVISIGGGVAGLSPLMPERLINAEMAKTLSGASTSIGSAGTGVQSLGSTFSTRTEGKRTVIQMNLKRVETKEEDRKGAKHTSKENLRSALDTLKGLWEKVHNAFSSQAQ